MVSNMKVFEIFSFVAYGWLSSNIDDALFSGQLWDILGDLSKPLSYTVKHFLSRAVCLILLPALLYITFFYIHLRDE